MFHHQEQEIKQVDLTHGKTRYILEGNDRSNDLVICIHGIGSFSYTFEFLSQRLKQQKFEILRFDLYGRGFSDHPDEDHTCDLFCTQLWELLRKLHFMTVNGRKRPNLTITLLAHSMGGGIAVDFADKYPNIVDQLILLTPACTPFELPFGSGLLRMKTIGDWAFSLNNLLMDKRKGVATEFYDAEKSERGIDWILQNKAMVDSRKWQASFLNSFRNFPLNGLSEVVKRVGETYKDKRVLILWAMYDTTVSPTTAFTEFWQAFQSPNHEFVAMADTRHTFYMERIEDCNELITNWIRKRTEPEVSLTESTFNKLTEYDISKLSTADRKLYDFWMNFQEQIKDDKNKSDRFVML
jgi:pimeloyl-ACP methyl ester carboxylesterase